MIAAAHQTMMGPPALPYDAEVEYLSSNGSQWVDTGVIPTFPDDLTYSAGIMWSNVTTRNIMGRQGSFYVGCVNGGFQPGFGSNEVVSGLTISANTKYDIVVRFCPTSPGAADTVYYKIGATEGSRISWFQNLPENGPVWIFVANNATTLRGASRVYYFQISRNGTTLRDYIPVRVGSGSSAVGYLFDRVSGTLFGNAGTGAFTIGPDKT